MTLTQPNTDIYFYARFRPKEFIKNGGDWERGTELGNWVYGI